MSTSSPLVALLAVLGLASFACAPPPASNDAGATPIDAGATGDADAGADAGQPVDAGAFVTLWQQGNPSLGRVEQLAFAADGTLFLADGTGGKLVAVDLGPATEAERPANHFTDLPRFGANVGAALGSPMGLSIGDVDVHPVSHRVYFAASNATTNALLTVDGAGTVTAVDLRNVRYASVPFTVDMAGSMATDLDVSGTHVVAAIASRTFTSGRVLSVPLPLDASSTSSAATTRTYHRVHRMWEQSDTVAPVDRLMVVGDASPPFVAASYACAPVVRLPLSGLASGGQVIGQTPFDIGAGRQLLDLFGYTKAGRRSVLMSFTTADRRRFVARADHDLLAQSTALDAAAPVVVDANFAPTDPRVTMHPEFMGVISIAPRGDDRFVAVYGTGRLATHELP